MNLYKVNAFSNILQTDMITAMADIDDATTTATTTILIPHFITLYKDTK
ncbi:protein of unknown function [Candidatus Nitrosocaldus cavascurensis]|jgi:hypothetical protein|uniref:Uncharacterized protein n=1 Tax=Candidatus Nitrosocaldus cavascurensis TaxID=2058097 RepID=A0A2K5AT75_9ARCH|nr:protein of unknown function [Candidatus Nitrosocaldus cavascurensis]